MSAEQRPPLPERDQIAALTALILLAYGLIRIVTLPAGLIELEALGLLVRLEFNARLVMVGLAGALAAIGSEWVMHSHPISSVRSPGLGSRVLPGLAALSAGGILSLLPLGPLWVLGLALAGGLIFAVLLAEFVVLDREDARTPQAGAAIRLLGVLIAVGVAYAVRANQLRAIFLVPAVFAVVALVCWRAIGLAVPRSRQRPYAIACGLLAAQLAWGLHYWPIRPVQLALLVGLVSYLGSGLGIANLRGRLRPDLLYEFSAVAVATVAVVLLLG